MMLNHAKNQAVCSFCGETFYHADKQLCKNRDHYHFTSECKDAVNSVCSFRYDTPKIIHVVIQNRSFYDDHFIIKSYQMSLK